MTKVASTKRIEKNLIDPVAMRGVVVNCIVNNDFTYEIPPFSVTGSYCGIDNDIDRGIDNGIDNLLGILAGKTI